MNESRTVLHVSIFEEVRLLEVATVGLVSKDGHILGQNMIPKKLGERFIRTLSNLAWYNPPPAAVQRTCFF